MNCKPGDLAMVVRCSPGSEITLGHTCEIVEMEIHPITKEIGWLVDPPCANGHDCIVDAFLRPLRDPGADAVDEMVQKLGKPEGVTA